MTVKKLFFNSLKMLIAVGLAFVIYAAYQFAVIRSSNSITAVTQSDCIVVLGAAVREGGQPSPVFGDRLTRAAELYRAGVSRKIIVSGGLGKYAPAEAEAGRAFLINAGVADSDIIRETNGMTTAEQGERVREICERENFKTIALVTSFFHERRAIQIFNRAGLTSITGARCMHTRFEDINRWVLRESIALAMMNWWTWAIFGTIGGLLFVLRWKKLAREI